MHPIQEFTRVPSYQLGEQLSYGQAVKRYALLETLEGTVELILVPRVWA